MVKVWLNESLYICISLVSGEDEQWSQSGARCIQPIFRSLASLSNAHIMC